jgi:hypothetical protein
MNKPVDKPVTPDDPCDDWSGAPINKPHKDSNK